MAEFQIQLDHHSGVPIYRQIMDEVQRAIAVGALSSHDLPGGAGAVVTPTSDLPPSTFHLRPSP